jgi:hypothetical protein
MRATSDQSLVRQRSDRVFDAESVGFGVSGGDRPAHPRRGPAIVLGHSSGRFLAERTHVRPRLFSRIRKQSARGGLRLRGLIILFVAHGGPRRGIGGGPVHRAERNKRERLAGPSVPSFATPNSWFDFTPRFSQRAERRRCTRRLRPVLSRQRARCRPGDRN